MTPHCVVLPTDSNNLGIILSQRMLSGEESEVHQQLCIQKTLPSIAIWLQLPLEQSGSKREEKQYKPESLKPHTYGLGKFLQGQLSL